MTALALLVTQNVFAADPDLSGYTAIKTMDFSKATYANDVNITLSTTQCGTAFETGNKLYQKIYEVANLKICKAIWLCRAFIQKKVGGYAQVRADCILLMVHALVLL